MQQRLIYISTFLLAFFPAYLGHIPSLARIGHLTTIGFALACYIPFLRDMKGDGYTALAILIIFGYIIESIGVLTCLPYGCFVYSEQLGTKILGIVPWLLAVTWPPLVVGVWSWVCRDGFVTRRCIGHATSVSLRPYIGGLLLVLIDLILDPIAVQMGLRSYPGGGFWFGVPWTNFAGWMLSGTIGIAILDHFLIKKPNTKRYDTGLWLFLCFFVGYSVWRFILLYLSL